jgi:hypothetical protein
MADHMLCCDERAEHVENDLCIIEWDDAPEAQCFVLTNDDGRHVAAITHCPWCGVLLDKGAEGFEAGDVDTALTATLRIGSVVRAVRPLDPEGANVAPGTLGVVFAPANHYGDDAGPMVRWTEGNAPGGACNVYEGDVEVLA